MKIDLNPPFGPAEPHDGYAFGPFRLDVRKRRLWKNDALVPVTPKAFETLLALVSQSGTIIDKDDLLKRVWPDTFVNEETLTQNISTLRKALGDTSDQPEYIATIPRRGYQFIGTLRELVPDTSGTSVDTSAHGLRRAAPGSSWMGGRGPWIALAAGAIVSAVALGFAYLARSDRQPAAGDRIHLVVTPPDGTKFAATGSVLSLSPDGTRLAFVAVDERGVSRLWLRVLGSPSPRVLEGTEDAAQPFWSGDGTSLAFVARGKLRRIDLDAGRIRAICEGGLAGTWNRDGVILFPPGRDSGIFRVSAEGGVPVQVTSLDKTLNETDHLWPVFLPDGQHFLFFGKSANPEQSAVYVGSIDEPRTRIRVMSSSSSAEYAWPGYLLFRQGDVLVARAFDRETFRLIGEMTTVAERVVYNAATGRVPVSASTRTGVIAYRTWTDNELVWVDRSGRRLERVGPPGPFSNPSLSRDGSRVAVGRLDPSTGTEDIWVIDMARGGIAMRLTSHPAEDTQPLWSPDGERVLFNSNRSGQFDFYEKMSNGSQDERLLFATRFRKLPVDWSHDGRSLLYYSVEKSHEPNLWVLPLEGPRVPRQLVRTELSDSGGALSPDGRWLAYVTSESGVEHEVFVQSLHETGQKWQISSGGGREPHWRSDGRELFFLALDDKLMSVMIDPGSARRKIGAPRALFPAQIRGNVGGVVRKRYAVAPDGQRFLLNVPVEGAAGSPIHVIVNWPG